MTNSEDCDSNDKVGIEIMMMKEGKIMVEGIVSLVLLFITFSILILKMLKILL